MTYILLLTIFFFFSFRTSKPFILILPPDGSRSPHIIFIRVVLPAPLGPRRPKISPLFTSNVTESTALNFPNIFVTDLHEIM